MDKELKKLLRKLEDQGWRIEPTRKGTKALPPDTSKSVVMIHHTPSDRRAWSNMLSALRRSGFQG